MTLLSARGRKDRLLRVFERTGGPGSSTRSFDSLPEVAQERIRRGVETKEGEELILASYRDERHWVLLTSERLVATDSTVKTSLLWSEISDATVEVREVQASLASSKGKLSLRRLRVIRADGRALDLELEPGPSFIALWNVLKSVAALRATL